MNKKKLHILVTGAGAPGAPSIIRMLRKNKNYEVVIHSADANALSGGSYFADTFDKIPLANDSHFVEKVIEVCIKHKVKLLISFVTKELDVLSENSDIFEKYGVKVCVLDYTSMHILNDKLNLYNLGVNIGMNIPKYYRVSDSTELISLVRKMLKKDNKCVIKPSKSNGSRGFRVISTEFDALDLVLNHKPQSIYMTKESFVSTFENKDIPEYMISEYLDGEEYTVDALCSNGTLITAVIRERVKMSGGITTVGKIVKNAEIIKQVKLLSSSLKLTGFLGVQFKNHKDKPYLLEVNPRLQGTTVISLAAGVNFPTMICSLYMGEELPTDFKINYGTIMIRHWDEVYLNDESTCSYKLF